jgi:uncharacterized oxidoreductase
MMLKHGNTMLITGGGSGIGQALAHRWHDRGNKVIVVGRQAATLESAVRGRPGMSFYVLDIGSPVEIASVAKLIVGDHPDLNVLVNNAGASFEEDLTTARDLSNAETMVTTNFLGPIRIINAFIDHLRTRQHAAIVNVSSGVGFVPYAAAPTYSATKAAVHSYTAALRALLAGSVEVIEIVPPQVATDLTPSLRDSPYSVPLDTFADEVISLFDDQPLSDEIIVEGVKPFRFAERQGRTDELIASMLPIR